MKIVVEGCAHGDLDRIYEIIGNSERERNLKFDLLICCGDFQSTRNLADLSCMAVPTKYLDMCSFYKYYSGEKIAPLLTIFIGGNHEASNYLQELAYGGWVAKNIYYLGYAGVINVNGIRIGGISGIFREYNFEKGHFEFPPYDHSSCRSAYSIRSLEVFRLSQLSGKIDIMLSHDWPQGIWDYGNKEQLLRFKPYFYDDMESGRMGSGPCMDLLKDDLKPSHWYSAHMHCRFDATVLHDGGGSTKFVALDKCLPKRRCLDFLTIGEDEKSKDSQDASSERKMPVIKYDLEWLTILYLTNNLLNVTRNQTKLPLGPSLDEQQDGNNIKRFEFTPSQEEMDFVLKKFNNDLTIPTSFVPTVPPYDPRRDGHDFRYLTPQNVMAELNPQTTKFCEKLGVDDPLYLAARFENIELRTTVINSEENVQSTTPQSSIVKAPLASLLPLPKFRNDEDDEIATSSEIVEDFPQPHQSENPSKLCNDEEIDLNDLEDDEEAKITKQEIVNESTSSAKIVEEPSQVQEKSQEVSKNEPQLKKFKRRNENIYAADDD